MAIILTEGFDLIATNTDLNDKGWGNAEGSISATANKWGGPAYNVGSNQNMVLSRVNNPGINTHSHYGISFWVKLSNLTATPTGTFVVLGDSTTAKTSVSAVSLAHFALGYGGNGDIIVYRANAAVVQTLTGAFQAGVWHHLELRARANAVSGYIELWWDGIKQVDVTGIDTIDNGLGYVGTMTIGACNNVTSVMIDDLIISQDTTNPVARVGSHRIQTLLPTGAGVNAGFTGTFADVDDPIGTAADGDTTHVVGTTLNTQQDYAFSDLTGTPNIIAVNVVTEARKTDAGAMGLSPVCISSGTEALGSQVGLSEGYAPKSHVYTVDPNTSATWTAAGVNAATFGFKITEV